MRFCENPERAGFATIRMQKIFWHKYEQWNVVWTLFPFSLIARARPSEEGANNNPSEGSLGFLGTAACTNGWNMNLGPVARNREVVSQKNCSQLYSSHRTLYFSQLLDDWSNPCDVFVWTVFISLQKCSSNTIRSIVSWRIKLLVAAVVGCGRELGKAVSESRVK